jgi:hypothetical protein
MSMKTLKEYLTESKKSYTFHIKVAGDLSEGFEDKVKGGLAKYGCSKVAKHSSAPIRPTALDFPELKNVEVTCFEAECEYPVTPREIAVRVREMTGISEAFLKVRTLGEELEPFFDVDSTSGQALLNQDLKDPSKINHKDYFGNDHTVSFLKSVAKEAKARKKDEGQNTEYKLPKHKEDKAGSASPITRSPR